MPPLGTPKLQSTAFSFPWSVGDKEGSDAHRSFEEEKNKPPPGPPGPSVAERFSAIANAVPQISLSLPTIHLLDPTYFHHLDPPSRTGCEGSSMSERKMENPLKVGGCPAYKCSSHHCADSYPGTSTSFPTHSRRLRRFCWGLKTRPSPAAPAPCAWRCCQRYARTLTCLEMR